MHRDRRAPGLRGGELGGSLRPDRRVRDRLQGSQRLRLAEDQAPERGPIQGPVRQENLCPEAVLDRGQPGGAWLDNLARDPVRVDDSGTALGQSR